MTQQSMAQARASQSPSNLNLTVAARSALGLSKMSSGHVALIARLYEHDAKKGISVAGDVERAISEGRVLLFVATDKLGHHSVIGHHYLKNDTKEIASIEAELACCARYVVKKDRAKYLTVINMPLNPKDHASVRELFNDIADMKEGRKAHMTHDESRTISKALFGRAFTVEVAQPTRIYVSGFYFAAPRETKAPYMMQSPVVELEMAEANVKFSHEVNLLLCGTVGPLPHKRSMDGFHTIIKNGLLRQGVIDQTKVNDTTFVPTPFELDHSLLVVGD